MTRRRRRERPRAGRGDGEPRHLRYDEEEPARAGINHLRRNLEVLLREAHREGRLAVLPALNLAPRHNFGVDRQWRWDTYFDLDASVLVDAAGAEHPLPLAAQAPEAGRPALVLDRGAPIPASAAGHPLVVRRIANPVFGKDVRFVRHGPPDFRFRPAPRVVALARHVVAGLRERGGGAFCAVHVRRTDRLFGPMRWLTRPARVRARLRASGVADGAVVYVLSDERAAGFWDPLAADYDLAVCRDFARLAAVVSANAPGGPDNYLLYEVEKQIMRAASRRIETFPVADSDGADATLVPRPVWAVSRAARRCKNAAGEGFRRSVRGILRGVLGPRAWAAAKGLAASRRRKDRGSAAGPARRD